MSILRVPVLGGVQSKTNKKNESPKERHAQIKTQVSHNATPGIKLVYPQSCRAKLRLHLFIELGLGDTSCAKVLIVAQM